MAGISTSPTIELEVIGKYGKYRTTRKLGSGGNGSVFAVDIIEGGKELPKKDEFAIKFLTVNPNDLNELEKRRNRFIKEINEVQFLQKNIDSIIPIYDFSILCDDGQEYIWYLMPYAKPYNHKLYKESENLTYMLQLGNCIKQLHKKGYAHRDIKPKNLLIYNGKICLSDFGLIWNIDDTDEHITEVNDRLGPQAIRPPELQPVEKLDVIDYRCSDVYLFAKTIWIVLKNNNNGFSGEYSRINDSIYIDKNEIHVETAEPLHKLMIEATKHDYWDRCCIDVCLGYLENQIKVMNGNATQKELRDWEYEERIGRNKDIITPEEKIYKDSSSIVQILNDMAGVVELAFESQGKEICYLSLLKSKHIKNDLFEIEVSNPYDNGRKKIIELAILEMKLKKDKAYEFYSKLYSFDDEKISVFPKIIHALECPEKRVRLRGIYLIKMRIKQDFNICVDV